MEALILESAPGRASRQRCVSHRIYTSSNGVTPNTTDTHWDVNGNDAVATTRNPLWIANGTNEDSTPYGWISYDDNTHDSIDSVNTVRSFTTTVSVPASANLGALMLSGRVASDNRINDILVNGVSTGIEVQSETGYGVWTPITLTAKQGLTSGTNIITFLVQNDGRPVSNNPTGLVVDWIKPGELDRHLHQAQEYDAASALHQSNAPGTRPHEGAIWLSQDRDPLERDGTNKYWFARNNGISNVDLTGLSANFGGGGFDSFRGGSSWNNNSIDAPGASFGTLDNWNVNSILNIGSAIDPMVREFGGSVWDRAYSGEELLNQYAPIGREYSGGWDVVEGFFTDDSITQPEWIRQVSTRAGGVSQASLSAAWGIVTLPAALTGVGALNTGFAADNTLAGLKTALTGEYHQTYTARGSSNVAQYFGASPETGNLIGEGVNFVGSSASGIGVARNLPRITALSQNRALATIEAVDTIAPRVNPLNYSLPKGLFSGTPIPQYTAPQGGTYLLATRNTGQVVRTGRTGNLIAREKRHRLTYEDTLIFERDVLSNSYAVQRGAEQVLHHTYRPILNKISPIRSNNPWRDHYLNSYHEFVQGLQ